MRALSSLRSSLRVRLTLWYVGALALVLLGFSAGGYLVVERSLHDRVDARLTSTLQAAAALLRARSASGDAGGWSAALQEARTPSQTLAIVDGGGQVLAQVSGSEGPPLRRPAAGLNPTENAQFYELPESAPESDDSCRGATQRLASGASAGASLVVVESLEPLSDELDLLLNVLYIVVPATLLLAGGGGWLLARRALAPVTAMAEHVRQITAQSMEQRVEIVNPRDEIGRLAATFNDLLARLSASLSQQRQFMADASHELRTPLSAIRTTSAVMLERNDREKDEYREALTIVEQESRRLSRIVADMFLLARADAGHPTLQRTDFYLDELLAETGRAAAVLATQKNLRLEVAVAAESPLSGDAGLLRQMIWNLLDNAIKHTPPGGRVRVTLDALDTEYSIRVVDTGGGIPADLQAAVFERFRRVDEARSHRSGTEAGGAGLGLPIARWIAEAHHGRLELQSSTATGSTFAVFLPRT